MFKFYYSSYFIKPLLIYLFNFCISASKYEIKVAVGFKVKKYKDIKSM